MGVSTPNEPPITREQKSGATSGTPTIQTKQKQNEEEMVQSCRESRRARKSFSSSSSLALRFSPWLLRGLLAADCLVRGVLHAPH